MTACDGEPDDPEGDTDPVELSLARALELAAGAGEYAVVATLARELAERRRAREAPGVASLESARARKGAAK